MAYRYFSLAFEYKQDAGSWWDWKSFVAAEEELRAIIRKLGKHVRIRHAESTTDGHLYKYARAEVDAQALSEVIEKVAEDLDLEHILGVQIADEEEMMNPNKSGFDTLSDYMKK